MKSEPFIPMAGRVSGRRERQGLFAFLQNKLSQRSRPAECDLNELLEHCRELMSRGDCEAKPFERAVRMLRQASRYEEEVQLCRYVRDWANWRETEYIFGSKMWLSSRYKRLIAREAAAQALLDKQSRNLR